VPRGEQVIDESKSGLDLIRRESVFDRHAEEGGVEPGLFFEPRFWTNRPSHSRHLVEAVRQQPIEDLISLRGIDFVLCDGPDHLEHAVTSGCRSVLGGDQGLVDECLQRLDDDAVLILALTRDSDGGTQSKAAREHGQAAEQTAFVVAEHAQAPLNRRSNAAMAVGAAPARITEPGHVLLQHGQDLANRERGDAGRRQFDRQRDTVE
jgi:hypothetical protein